ncbi:MAG: hypothetical protein MI919_08750, partial [Holophagales bacterium]|nr:hypothetical protein [Holophagales bacterium]
GSRYRPGLEVRVLGAEGCDLGGVESNLDTAVQTGVEIPIEFGETPSIEPHPDPNLGQTVRIRGRLVSADDLGKIADRQVVLWGKRQAQLEAVPLLAARTDQAGYFGGTYPTGPFDEAFGRVPVGGTPVDASVHLLEDGTFPREILLVVDLGAESGTGGDSDDCACQTPVPRAPDSDDLVTSSAYSADLGGCVDFTVPNRTLEEFSFYQIVRTTEPELRGRAPRDVLTISNDLKYRILLASRRSDSPDDARSDGTLDPVFRLVSGDAERTGGDMAARAATPDPDGNFDPTELDGLSLRRLLLLRSHRLRSRQPPPGADPRILRRRRRSPRHPRFLIGSRPRDLVPGGRGFPSTRHD